MTNIVEYSRAHRFLLPARARSARRFPDRQALSRIISLTVMGDTFDKVRGNALISIPADIRWQKMSGWRLDFGGEETRIIMKNE